VNPEKIEVSGDSQLYGRAYSLEVANRPIAYTLEEEQDEEKVGHSLHHQLQWHCN
jgi:hypothetical protein